MEEIKELIDEANELSTVINHSNQVSCSDEDRLTDVLAELFTGNHIDWLYEQAEKFQKVIYEVEHSDMGTAVGNIVEIVSN